ncbi:MAG: hypothetical protein HGA85_08310, partial [Nanoarchaeota archaeon]|nr:hypothetical protein [Nanoarchaeota archaeon]
MHLVDGGLAEAMPIRLVEEMGADVIIGVDLYWKDYYRYDRNVSSVLERTYRLMLSKLSDVDSKTYGKNVIILRPRVSRLDTFAFDTAAETIKIGETCARANIAKIKRMIQ